tara:strand:- start:1239 stop:1469 length:231 start_codon:yes stop_codon:yes gene_type:complete
MNFKEILSETLGYDSSNESNDEDIKSMPDFDSMNHMIFISKLEENYNIVFSGEEIMSMTSTKSIKSVLKDKGIDNP